MNLFEILLVYHKCLITHDIITTERNSEWEDKNMDKKDAEMLARAICDKQDQRERDSKLVPSQEYLLRQSRARMREQQRRHGLCP